MLKILGRISSINVRKVTWACGEIGIPYEREDWGAGFKSAQSPEFLALNPNGLIPVVIDENGPLWESNAICRYLAAKHRRTDLLPEDPHRRAVVDQWMDWQATEFNYSWRYAVMALVRKHPDYKDEDQIEASLKAWRDKIAVIEGQIKAPFLTGDSFTIADIVVGLSINRWLKTPRTHGEFPEVRAYVERLMQRPAALAHAGFDLP
jgi:glutathione S-transferase